MAEEFSTRYGGCMELSQLPYFETDDKGRLVARREEVGEVIDFHTHLGLTFAVAPKLNLRLETPRIDYMLPYDHPFDLEEYSARSFSPEAAKKVVSEYLRCAWSSSGFVRTHTTPNILRDMDRMGVTHSVLHADDLPGVRDNTGNFLSAADGDRMLAVFGSVHPYSTRVERKVIRMIKLGAVGMKMHPAEQLYTAANKRAYKVYELCDHYRLPILFHTGASDIAPKWQKALPAIRHFRNPVREFPNLIFIFGHSGIHQYEEAIELASKHENIYLEVSGQPPHRIKKMIDGMGSERILFGSDWPFYAIELPLAKALIATEGMPEVRRKILAENAKRLMGVIYGEKSPF